MESLVTSLRTIDGPDSNVQSPFPFDFLERVIRLFMTGLVPLVCCGCSSRY